jgi:leader peptidase (prepilin peptidase)/N-methyltransferase
MKSERLKLVLPYAGLPFIAAAMLFFYAASVDAFILLWCELLIIFGYVASVLDIKNKTIPNKLVLIMLAAWVITFIPKLLTDTDTAINLLFESLLGFAAGGGLFLLVYIVSRKGLGGGDVKFMAAAGLYTGLTGVISAMLYGSVMAALVGIVLMIIKKIGRKDTFPLAPFLYLGILITIFYR